MFLGLRQLAGINLDQFEPSYAAALRANSRRSNPPDSSNVAATSSASARKTQHLRTKSSSNCLG